MQRGFREIVQDSSKLKTGADSGLFWRQISSVGSPEKRSQLLTKYQAGCGRTLLRPLQQADDANGIL